MISTKGPWSVTTHLHGGDASREGGLHPRRQPFQPPRHGRAPCPARLPSRSMSAWPPPRQSASAARGAAVAARAYVVTPLYPFFSRLNALPSCAGAGAVVPHGRRCVEAAPRVGDRQQQHVVGRTHRHAPKTLESLHHCQLLGKLVLWNLGLLQDRVAGWRAAAAFKPQRPRWRRARRCCPPPTTPRA